MPILPVQRRVPSLKEHHNGGAASMKKNSGMFGLQVDFFLPVWRRYLLIAVCVGWSIMEFVTAAPFWGIIFGGLGAVATWQLFFDGWPDSENQSRE